MGRLFGPATESIINQMTEENCIELCRARVLKFLGEQKAKEFDEFING